MILLSKLSKKLSDDSFSYQVELFDRTDLLAGRLVVKEIRVSFNIDWIGLYWLFDRDGIFWLQFSLEALVDDDNLLFLGTSHWVDQLYWPLQIFLFFLLLEYLEVAFLWWGGLEYSLVEGLH